MPVMREKVNAVQFAIVREDPEIETTLLKRLSPEPHVLLIGSGGCTALTLQRRFPQSQITVLDPNPSQLKLIQEKIHVLLKDDGQRRNCSFGIGKDDPTSLTACGNFESLFRSLRQFLYEFVLDRRSWLSYFSDPKTDAASLDSIFQSKYWSVAFQLYFSDSLLIAMFGQNAIQHAAPNSYPAYFQNVIERGLKHPDAKSNYFLHHILLGHYLEGFLPAYLTETSAAQKDFHFVEGLIQNVASFDQYDLISLSNIFDWMPSAEVAAIAQRISNEAKPGAMVVYRQLNNFKNVQTFFERFEFNEALAAQLHAQDRSLFYSSLHIGAKSKGTL